MAGGVLEGFQLHRRTQPRMPMREQPLWKDSRLDTEGPMPQKLLFSWQQASVAAKHYCQKSHFPAETTVEWFLQSVSLSALHPVFPCLLPDLIASCIPKGSCFPPRTKPTCTKPQNISRTMKTIKATPVFRQLPKRWANWERGAPDLMWIRCPGPVWDEYMAPIIQCRRGDSPITPNWSIQAHRQLLRAAARWHTVNCHEQVWHKGKGSKATRNKACLQSGSEFLSTLEVLKLVH